MATCILPMRQLRSTLGNGSRQGPSLTAKKPPCPPGFGFGSFKYLPWGQGGGTDQRIRNTHRKQGGEENKEGAFVGIKFLLCNACGFHFLCVAIRKHIIAIFTTSNVQMETKGNDTTVYFPDQGFSNCHKRLVFVLTLPFLQNILKIPRKVECKNK